MKIMNKKMIYRYVALMLVIAMALPLSACGKKKTATLIPGSSILPAPTKSVTEVETGNADEIKLTGILTYVNTSEYAMHFIDVDTGTEYEVLYSGGTDIKNQYDSVIAASNMKMGDIFNIVCNKNGKATSIHESSDYWEKKGVTDIKFDENNRKLTFGASTYVYEKFAAVISGGEKISIAEIVPQDEVTIRGNGNTVYSISVDKGHGYLSFTGIDSFIGGYATIGEKQLLGVTSGMLATAKEGTYTIELQKNSLTGYKTVTVERGKQTTVDFSECTTEAGKMGAINFSITPDNAILAIDGVEMDYSSPISLPYGKHTVTLSANHYEAYQETFYVNSDYKTMVIDMTATSSATTKSSNTTHTTSAASSATTGASLTEGYSISVTAPEGAALYVDSVYVGIIPCSFDKKAGTKTITLSKSGYNTVSYSVSIPNSTGNLTYAFPDMVTSSTTESTTAATTK